MKNLLFLIFILYGVSSSGQDAFVDYSLVNKSSISLEYILPLFTIYGTPQNQNINDTVSILINHGYCLAYSKKYNQPLWVSYQVSKAKRDVDYERFPYFVNDTRLDSSNQIGTETFGNELDLGHYAPNATINKQYGKLSQMETFLMSNISPQKSNLNRGVWKKLEFEILNKYVISDKNHLWVTVGPIFSDTSQVILRKNGTKVIVPDAFYCILIRPVNYGSSDYISFIFPQNISLTQKLDLKFVVSINKIEKLTNINFFPNLSKIKENNIENFVSTILW